MGNKILNSDGMISVNLVIKHVRIENRAIISRREIIFTRKEKKRERKKEIGWGWGEEREGGEPVRQGGEEKRTCGTIRELETTWRMVDNVWRVQKGPVMNLERKSEAGS